MCGNFVKIIKDPEYRSLEKCKEAMRKKAPTPGMEDLIDYDDMTCQCCEREVPNLAGAIVLVNDETPSSTVLSRSREQKINLCADCYYFGVRPKNVRFGSINWNSEGDKIKARANSATGTPW